MNSHCSRVGSLTLVGLGVLAFGLVACGPTADNGGGGGGNKDGGTRDGWSWNYGDASVYIPDGGELCPDCEQDAGACAANTTKAQELPLDIYVMLDQSGSMADPVSGGTKWTAVTGALEAFLQQPLTDVSVGIQFFGVAPAGGVSCNTNPCNSNSDCPGSGCGPCTYDSYYGMSFCAGAAGDTDSCNAADYANPAVEIAPLPGVYNAIKTAIDAHGPTTLTPTSAALQGAVNHAKSWSGFHPQHVTIVIFATDGDPTECDPQDMPSIDAIAAAGFNGTPKIRTYVIGVGTSLSNLNGIANAGGTTSAFMVDTGGNVQQQFLQAMNQIRGAALGCTYQIPDTGDAGAPDFTKVNVQYTPGTGGAAQGIPMAPSQASCPPNGDAWYYDNASAPTKIILCPYTCNRITPDSSGQVDILLGCQTQIIG
jgi:hypothetical protein